MSSVLVFSSYISMECSNYILLITELRQIAVARALVLLNDKEEVEDVAAEVMSRLWERHRLLRDDADEVRHYADTMARNFSLDLLRHQRRHPFLRIFYRADSNNEDVGSIPDVPDSYTLSSTSKTKRQTTSLERRSLEKKPRKGNKQNKREKLSLIKYKSKWRKNIKVHFSHNIVI